MADPVEMGGSWRQVWGQDAAVQTLQHAVENPNALAQSWLFTGPAGSGRSVLARAFAAALVSGGTPNSQMVSAQVLADSHPDVTVLRTQKVVISIAEARALVERAAMAATTGKFRVLIIEDADRMTERTSNVLLKALEEPPPDTVWILCAPSEADLLPTIRSRVRILRLAEPGLSDVARIIAERTGVSADLAEQSARHAQHHIGMAQRLATDQESRVRRDRTLREILGVRGVSTAVQVAATILEEATADAKSISAEKDAADRQDFLRSLGLTDGQAIPPALRSSLHALEEDQKKRATRSVRDGIDRVLTDMQGLMRDVSLLQWGQTDGLINIELKELIAARAQSWQVLHPLDVVDEIVVTRRRLERNVAPLLALESLMVTVALGKLV